jgi:hypothetical protein
MGCVTEHRAQGAEGSRKGTHRLSTANGGFELDHDLRIHLPSQPSQLTRAATRRVDRHGTV